MSGTRVTYQVCGLILPAWLLVFQAPNGVMQLHHLTQQHQTEARAYMTRMHTTEDIAAVAVEAFEVVEAEGNYH